MQPYFGILWNLFVSNAAAQDIALDIQPDWSLVVLLAVPFFVSFLVLNFVLLRPLLNYLTEREAVVVEAQREADALATEIEERVAQLDAKLAQAREEITALRTAARAEAHEQETAILEESRAQAERRIEEGLARVAKEREQASEVLRQTTQELSRDIASRVLGRAVQI